MGRALALGFLVGLPIAATPGPMFVLVLRRTLDRGWRSGLSSGFGIATGDAIYAALAAFGVAAVTNLLIAQRRWIGLVGGVALALIGLQALLNSPPGPSRTPQTLASHVPTSQSLASHVRAAREGRRPGGSRGPAGPAREEGENRRGGRMTSHLASTKAGGMTTDYASMVALTLSNPPTILSFTAVFAALGLRVSNGWLPALALVIGVMLGSAVWWVVVTIIASLMRDRLTPVVMRGIGVVSGLALTGFGVVIAAQAL